MIANYAQFQGIQNKFNGLNRHSNSSGRPPVQPSSWPRHQPLSNIFATCGLKLMHTWVCRTLILIHEGQASTSEAGASRRRTFLLINRSCQEILGKDCPSTAKGAGAPKVWISPNSRRPRCCSTSWGQNREGFFGAISPIAGSAIFIGIDTPAKWA
jgi:hypothetical protein